MKPFYKITLLFSLLLISSYQVCGQEKVNLYAGVAVPEQFVLGPRFQINQFQLGLGIGTSKYQLSISGDVCYHFAGSSQMSGRKPWYIKGGVSKWIDYSEEQDKYPLGFYFRTGRDINLSNRVGINIELGMVAGKLANELYGNRSVFPSLGIFLFYRI
jgi:hypothetical protein